MYEPDVMALAGLVPDLDLTPVAELRLPGRRAVAGRHRVPAGSGELAHVAP